MSDAGIDLDVLAEKIARSMARLPKAKDILWSAKDCAQYLGISERHFVDRCSKRLGHPKPVVLSDRDCANPTRRWYMNEIIDDARKRKSKSA